MTLGMAEITGWLGGFLWPFFRIGAMFMLAPVIGSTNVPMRVRLMLALAVTVVVYPSLPQVPAVTPFSWPALGIIFQQLLTGLALGFALLLVFGAVVTGGQIIAMQMGLGFATMVDPQNGTQVPVLSQLYTLMTTLLFLSMDAHLVMIQLLAESFRVLPIAEVGMDRDAFHALAGWGTNLFAGALWLALPAVASLLLVNTAFGVMARAAPQLNIFAIGFPFAMIMGFVVILFSLPNLLPQFSHLLEQGFGLFESLLGGGGN
ncbi:MAG: flagellar biosynthetic protein FliR [Pseudomonadota bacterium]